MAKVCNHTSIPECGQNTDGTDKRLFLDECDMFEYNCDNKKGMCRLRRSTFCVYRRGDT